MVGLLAAGRDVMRLLFGLFDRRLVFFVNICCVYRPLQDSGCVTWGYKTLVFKTEASCEQFP